MNFDEIRSIALKFPGTADHITHGTPSIKVGSKFLLREREPSILVLRCQGIDERDLLLEADPETFFITDHYRGYPYILTRMARLNPQWFARHFETIWRDNALKRHIKAHETPEGENKKR